VKKMIRHIIAFVLRCALWFRYKVTVKGLDKLNPDNLKNSGGVLFLPNHPSVFVDPALLTLALWPKFPIRPLIVEYQFYTPGVNWIMRHLDALPVPSFNTSSNSLKRKKSEKVIQTVVQDLKAGQSFLIYPAGKLKLTGYESIGGASAVHRVLNEAPEANVVLVRTKGLWGSTFSRAITGQVPPLWPTIWQGMKHVFKNLLFFTPRRHVIIEFEPAPPDFPQQGSRLEINKSLEIFYNQPDGLTEQKGRYPGDSLVLVSMSCWGKVYPTLVKANQDQDIQVSLASISDEVKDKVIQRLSELTERSPIQIKPEMNLATDLGMDSLDISEVVIFLQDQFEVNNVPYHEMTSVGKVMAIAAKQVAFKEEAEEEDVNISHWKKDPKSHSRASIAPGKTIPEVFLNNCDRMGQAVACADTRSGVMTYQTLKMRVLLLADYVRKLPGQYIGILMPATVAANVLILAIQMAGKIPLLINWTIGPRHLDAVVKLSNVQTVFTSWAFIDRLDNVDLTPIEDRLIMLEDLRHQFTLRDKFKALWRSKQKAKSLLKIFKIDTLSEEDQAVVLFTSGTESMPKGVPLSHRNILSNQRGIFEEMLIYSDDILLGMLPPFHAFGFTVTGIMCLLAGVKVAYSPDPKDGKKLAKAIERWGATFICGTPTFIKGIFKVAQPEQLKTVRFCFTGAEKAPPELFQMMKQFGGENFFLEGYGITECAPVLTFNRMGKPHRGVGLPAPQVDILIVHPETLEVLPVGTQGMILVRGPNIFAGYLNPGLSSPFIEINGKSWYKTGDLGYLDQEGYLFISGRLKRFIKIGAEMVSLVAIEEALLQIGLKKGWPITLEGPALAVCAKENSEEKSRIYLFTVFDVSLDEVNQAIKEAGFSNLVKISQVMRLIEIPIMGTGKINYRLLESEMLPKMEKQKITPNPKI
jgi:acyl carrier protein